MSPSTVEILATVCFSLAVLHTFVCSKIKALGPRFHILGEVELVFGLWALIFLVGYFAVLGAHETIYFVESQSFSEPIFVFAIMAMAATAPVLYLANQLILSIARLIPSSAEWKVFFAILSIGPLLGSLITEPAAMTVTALLLKQRYYDRHPSEFFKYVALAALLVNISIGGVLTNFAAPPVLMVASKWDWDLKFMLLTFGGKATIAVIANAALATLALRKELFALKPGQATAFAKSPAWLIAAHLLLIAALVYFGHNPILFLGIFIVFFGVVAATRNFQSKLRLRESFFVGIFLAGLVVLGSLQQWWLESILLSLTDFEVYFSAAALTAITDNAALTYLGSQISDISDSFKYFLVAGAVAGGGLTVIANAPNPAGFAILQGSFGVSGIKPTKLLLFALTPTLIALLCFYF